MSLRKILLSRYAISILFILAEVTGIVIFFLFLANRAYILWALEYLLAIVAFLYAINRPAASPESRLTWVSVILLLPISGAILYFIFSKRTLSRGEQKHLKLLTASLWADMDRRGALLSLLAEDPSAHGKGTALLHDDAFADLYDGTAATPFFLGEDMFSAMKEDLRRAESFIFLEYFIVERGEMWDELLAILEEKVKAGVEVRMLYDDIGCMPHLPSRYAKELRQKGIQCQIFSILGIHASPVHNNRDHRKILVIDGKIAYTGGVNLADEYINRTVRAGHWKDGGVRLEGDAAAGLTKLFLVNWDLNLRTVSAYSSYVLPSRHEGGDGGLYLPFGSGPRPLYQEPVGKNALLQTINQANRFIYITTPYLILEHEIIDALCNASNRGVEVKIITPHIPDKRLVHMMTRSTYPLLLAHGVQIYEYTPGFIHAKTLLCDDTYAIIGTINLDFRSLIHHYEDAVWMYRSPAIAAYKGDFLRTLEMSEAVPHAYRTPLRTRLLQACVRLFAPLF